MKEFLFREGTLDVYELIKKRVKDGFRSECRNCGKNNYLENKEYYNNKS
jgi:hypothetical protein